MYKLINGGNGSFELKICLIIMHFISGKNFHLLGGILSFMLETAKHHLNSARVGKLEKKTKKNKSK